MQLSLREVAVSQQRTFSVNGQNIRITVPAGVYEGLQIKLKGHGHQGYNGGPNGDLYITFHIVPDSQFERDGNDLKTTVNIDLYTAVLGGEVQIETLSGKVKMKRSTRNSKRHYGTTKKVKVCPFTSKKGAFGDLFVRYNVTLPQNLTDKQKALFEQLKNS